MPDEVWGRGSNYRGWSEKLGVKSTLLQSKECSKLASERENEPGHGADGDSNVCRQFGDVCWLCQQLLQYSTSEKSLVSIS